MKISVPGIFLSSILIFIAVNVVSIYFISVVMWRNDLNIVQNETRNYIDKIIDTRTNSIDAEEDYKLALAGCNGTFTYQLLHEAKATNPDGKGGTITSWVVTKENTLWNKGDIVSIKVTQESLNLFQKIAANMFGMNFMNTEVNMAGMVR